MYSVLAVMWIRIVDGDFGPFWALDRDCDFLNVVSGSGLWFVKSLNPDLDF